MKKLLLVLFGLFVLSSFSKNSVVNNNSDSYLINKNGIVESFKLINDTHEKVIIYTDYGFVYLRQGSTTNVNCNIGSKIYMGSNREKGDVIYEVEEDNMCGGVLKLSHLVDYF